MEKIQNSFVPIPGLISVVTPVYNSANFLNRCVQSIFEQIYQDFELILIDDGSTDSSGDLCEALAQGDQRIKVIHQENLGPAAARNAGIELARGEFLFFLDSDDVIENDSLEILMNATEQFDVDLVIGNFKRLKQGELVDRTDVRIDGSKLFSSVELKEYSRLYLKKPNKHLLFAYSWGRLFRTSEIKKKRILFNQSLRTFEDIAFNFEYLNHIDSAYYEERAYYHHTIRDDYATSATMSFRNEPRKLFGYMEALKTIAAFLCEDYPEETLNEELAHAYISLTIIQLIRTCVSYQQDNKHVIMQLIREITNEPLIRTSLSSYFPGKNESVLIPWLIRCKWTRGIVFVCRYKARNRYR